MKVRKRILLPDTRGYCKVKRAALYAGVSQRTFRKWLKDGLRHSRVRGTTLIRYSWIDEYLARYEVLQNEVDEIVEETLEELRDKENTSSANR